VLSTSASASASASASVGVGVSVGVSVGASDPGGEAHLWSPRGRLFSRRFCDGGAGP